jgi:hypothetical protein
LPPPPPGFVPPVVLPPLVFPPGTARPTTQPPEQQQPEAQQPEAQQPTAVDLQADANLVLQLKQIVLGQSDSLFLAWASLQPELPPLTSTPVLDTSTALAPYYSALVRRVNMLLYRDSNPRLAEEFVIRIANTRTDRVRTTEPFPEPLNLPPIGYQEVFYSFGLLLRDTPQYAAALQLVYPTIIESVYGSAFFLLKLMPAVYTMTSFFLLQNAPMVIPGTDTIVLAMRQAIDFLKYGITTFFVYILQLMTGVPAITSGQRYPVPPILNYTGFNTTENITRVNDTLTKLIDDPPGFSPGDLIASLVNTTLNGARLSAQTIEAGGYALDVIAEAIWDRLVKPAAAVGLGSVLTGRSAFGRAAAVGAIFAGSSIFFGLNVLAFGYGGLTAALMLGNIVFQVVSSAFVRGNVRTARDGNLAAPGEDNPEQNALRRLAANLGIEALQQPDNVQELARLLARVFARNREAAQNAAAQAAENAVSQTAGLGARFKEYSTAINYLGGSAGLENNRDQFKTQLIAILDSFGISRPAIDAVVDTMRTTGKPFQFYTGSTADSLRYTEQFESLYNLLNANVDSIAAFLSAYFTAFATTADQRPIVGNTALSPAMVFRSRQLLRFVYRFRLKNARPEVNARWTDLIARMYGVPVALAASLIGQSTGVAGSEVPAGDDILDTRATAPPAVVAPRPVATGPTSGPGLFSGDPLIASGGKPPPRPDTATAVSVPQPQYTDAGPTMTLEAAMSALQDPTNTVEKITRGVAPDSYQWFLIKFRRKALRQQWFSALVGLGVAKDDVTEALNFLDPTFVDASKSVEEYSGIRTNGLHGVYPRLDQFFVANQSLISRNFASRSSEIRVAYAATFFRRFFGLRGKYYSKSLFALSSSEMLQAAKLSNPAVDVVVMDYTFSDGVKSGNPTTEDLKGYQTGPWDFLSGTP